jgi:hypothetical protein
MKIFRCRLLSLLIYSSYIAVSTFNCNQISQGEQRRKFEFLYKLSNYISLTKEYTVTLVYFRDIPFFEERMKKMKEDIIKIEPVKTWNKSEVLKTKFITVLADNINSADSLKNLQLPPDESIKNSKETILIKERTSVFSEELDNVISEVGKE